MCILDQESRKEPTRKERLLRDGGEGLEGNVSMETCRVYLSSKRKQEDREGQLGWAPVRAE